MRKQNRYPCQSVKNPDVYYRMDSEKLTGILSLVRNLEDQQRLIDRNIETFYEVKESLPHYKISYNQRAGYYAQESTKPGLSSAVPAVLRRNKTEREQNRLIFDQITQDLKSLNGENSVQSISFQKRFALRATLGQPLTVRAYNKWEQSLSDHSFSLSAVAIDFYRNLTKTYSSLSPSRRGYHPIGED